MFGEMPHSLPLPHWPSLSFEDWRALVPAAMTIAVLGAIESLLSAVVSDGMIDDRHDSNQELMGQGIANMAMGIFRRDAGDGRHRAHGHERPQRRADAGGGDRFTR